MAKVQSKSKLKTFNKVLLAIFAILLVATILIVALSPAKSPIVLEANAGASDVDEIKIDEFVADTYGGVEFKSIEDVVNYYVEAYNYTKSLTAPYKNDEGQTETFYKLLGEEVLSVSNILVEGKENSMINSLVPSIVNSMFAANVYGLPPCTNRNPELDNNNGDTDVTLSFETSFLKAEDVLMANVKDNGDGTITLTIQPKGASMSMRGMDSQGNFFNVLGDIGATVDSISVLSWSEGTTEENCLVNYKGGSGEIVINTSTKEIVKADYVMNVNVEVKHANVTVIKNKNASLDIVYENHFPASDEYLLDARGIVRQ